MCRATEIQSHKSALVIGMGLSGRAATSLLLELSYKVIGVDKKKDSLLLTPEVQSLISRGCILYDEQQTISWDAIDLVVVSPGISKTHPTYTQALKLHKQIIGEVELAARVLASKKWIGITGTNGKTTVTLLVTHILNHAGHLAKALGNVGTPLSQEVFSIGSETIIAELSSFQLERLETPVLDYGVILNITPDHLDRYDSLEEYALAKLKMGRCLKEGGHLYLFEEINAPSGYRTFGYLPSCYAYTDLVSLFIEGRNVGLIPEEYRNRKSHDLENYMAAYLLCTEMGLSREEIISGFSTFKKPTHRVEFIRTVKGVSYYDDSKGTNLDAVIKAVASMQAPVVLIAGGVHKGASYKVWKDAFQGKVKAIYTIGEASSLIYKDLASDIDVEHCSTLEQAVENSSSLASYGDIVLLSPGCSSYDMFKDYAHRGNEFKRLVWGIVE